MCTKIFAPRVIEKDAKSLVSAFRKNSYKLTSDEALSFMARIYGWIDYAELQEAENNRELAMEKECLFVTELTERQHNALLSMKRLMINEFLDNNEIDRKVIQHTIGDIFNSSTPINQLKNLFFSNKELTSPLQIDNDTLRKHVTVLGGTTKQVAMTIETIPLPHLAANGGLLICRESVMDSIHDTLHELANAFQKDVDIINATASIKYKSYEIQSIQAQTVDYSNIDTSPIIDSLNKENITIIVVPDFKSIIDKAVASLITAFWDQLLIPEMGLPLDAKISEVIQKNRSRKKLRSLCIDDVCRFQLHQPHLYPYINQCRSVGIFATAIINNEPSNPSKAPKNIDMLLYNAYTRLFFNLSETEKKAIAPLNQLPEFIGHNRPYHIADIDINHRERLRY